MYRESYQRGVLTIFYSCGSNPLKIWDTCTKNGYITKILDEDIKSTVLEIGGTNVSTTYIICPKGKMVLGITMPYLVMIVKNMKKYFSFEVTILDDTGTRRRFRVSNFQSTTQILPLCTAMPINLSEGWNQIQFNMAEFCRKAYNKQYIEVQKFKINANIRVRRIYFADRILPEDQLPAEYKLFIPLKQGHAHKPKTGEKVVTPERVKCLELKKRGSKSSSASSVTKVASALKTVSKVLFEKKSSNVAEVAEVELTIKPATELPVATAEDSGAVAESGPDQSATVTEVPVTEVPVTEASATEAPATEASATEAPATEASATEAPATEAPVVTDVKPRTADAAIETTELVKEKSVEAAVQTEVVVTVVDAPVEDVVTDAK